MRSSIVLVALLLPVWFLAPNAPARPDEPASPAPQPRIEFPEITFDFGSVYQNEEVTHVFTFRNAGNAPLKIESVKSTCGCTAALSEAKEIAPGAASSVKVTFRSGSYRDRVTKHVTVDSNDPTQPRVTLTMVGVVKVEVEVKPGGVYLGSSVKVGEKVERAVEITPVDVKSFKITGVTSDNPNVQVSKPQPLGDNRSGYRLTITVGPLDKPGRVNARLTVHTDLLHSREIGIPVYGKIVAGDSPERARPQ
jgi:hypothetical protein